MSTELEMGFTFCLFFLGNFPKKKKKKKKKNGMNLLYRGLI